MRLYLTQLDLIRCFLVSLSKLVDTSRYCFLASPLLFQSNSNQLVLSSALWCKISWALLIFLSSCTHIFLKVCLLAVTAIRSKSFHCSCLCWVEDDVLPVSGGVAMMISKESRLRRGDTICSGKQSRESFLVPCVHGTLFMHCNMLMLCKCAKC